MKFLPKWASKKSDKNSERSKVFVGYSDDVDKTIYNLINYPMYNKVLFDSISTFHTCCKILSEDVASFPIKVYRNLDDNSKDLLKDDPRYFLLHREPNPYTTHYDFFSTIEYLRNKNGNVFIDININPLSLSLPLDPDAIDLNKYKIIDNQLYYYDNRIKDWNNSSNFLHFKTFSKEGVFGIDPTIPLSQNLGLTYKAFKTLDGIYENGGISTRFYKTTIPEGVNPKDWITSRDEWSKKYGGYKNAYKDVWLPPFVDQISESLNLQQAQFNEIIKFNTNQICSFYKISPDRVGNYETTKFNSLKETTLNYKIYTLRPILRMYREEFERKLLTREEILDGNISIEFNTKALLETDDKERMANLKEAFGMGSVTPNDICKMEGYSTFPEGNKHYLFNQLREVEKSSNKTGDDTSVSQ